MGSLIPIPPELADFLNPRPPRQTEEPLCEPEDEVQINFLADSMQHVDQVAQVIWDNWGSYYRNYGHIPTVEAYSKHLSLEFGARDRLDVCLVAKLGGEFAGTVSLCTDDVPVQNPYYGTKPWITCLFVSRRFRGRGVGSALLRAATKRLQQWGYRHAWLITQHKQRMYGTMGFRCIETLEAYGHPYTVMRADFALDGQPAIRTYTVEQAQQFHKKEQREREQQQREQAQEVPIEDKPMKE